ncbi:MAG: hypothetical protein WBA07_25435 [Rivularia sp. (in: cyanobacteria)]
MAYNFCIYEFENPVNNFVHRVRFYYEDGGKNSKIALDDIISILLYSQADRLKSFTQPGVELPLVSDRRFNWHYIFCCWVYCSC